MHTKSKLVPLSEAATFETDLLESGYLHVIKDSPEHLHPKEFLKFLHKSQDRDEPVGFTFIWRE